MNLDVTLYTPQGVRMLELDNVTRVKYARAANQIGRLVLDVPFRADLPRSALRRDMGVILEQDGDLVLDTRWLLLGAMLKDAPSGQVMSLTCVDGIDLLRRRIIDYDAGSSQAQKTGYLDNVLKALVRENLGSSASDTDRRLSTGVFQVQADVSGSIAISDTIFVHRRNLLQACQDIAKRAAQTGQYLSFDVVWTGTMYEFRTYAGWRGSDRRQSGVNPITLSLGNGSLSEITEDTDWEPEVSRMVVTASGAPNVETVVRVTSTSRASQSPFSYTEDTINASYGSTGDSSWATTLGYMGLRDRRARQVYTAKANPDAVGFQYGVQYQYGDVIPVEAFGQIVDCRLDAVNVEWKGGAQTVDLVLRSVT